MSQARIQLKPSREKSLLRRHPWIFSGAIAKTHGAPSSGDTVRIEANDGRFLAWGTFSRESQISARVWSFEADEEPSPTLIERRVADALRLRAQLLPNVDALRLISAESDGLPGVICDRYGDQLVLQLTSSGAVRWRDALTSALEQQTGLHQIYERSDGDVLALEGLPATNAALRGTVPEFTIPITEHELRFSVSVVHGHKTGFYLDQRDNRLLVREHARGAKVLDCFSFTGGFSINALAGGAASVTAIDSSKDALAQVELHAQLNAQDTSRLSLVEADVFKHLRLLRDQAQQFDLIVLDPPKFAPTAAQAQRAARGYKDINLLAFKLLNPGGLLFTFSCSGGVNRDLFQKIIAGAASDAAIDAHIIQHLSAGVDHPINLAFPEGDYLKGLLCRRV